MMVAGLSVLSEAAQTANELKAFVDEDQLRDTERGHTTEQVACIALEKPGVIPLSS